MECNNPSRGLRVSCMAMKPHTSLIILLILGIAGMVFSGYLSYGEFFVAEVPVDAAAPCVAPLAPLGGLLGSLPACIYGFIMYAGVTLFSILGLCGKRA